MIAISTCGTSLLTNSASAEIRETLLAAANKKAGELSPAEKAVIDSRTADIKRSLANAHQDRAAELSAEIAGLSSIANGDIKNLVGPGGAHYIVHTDTCQGEICANLVAGWLEANAGGGVVPLKIADLRANSQESAHWGLSELVKKIHEIRQGAGNQKIAFNLVGGFKLLQGFMQTIGMFYADEIYYLFEGTKTPIRIPKLSVKMDYDDATIQAMREIAFEAEPSAQHNLGILSAPDSPGMLSEWGELVWETTKEKYYAVLRKPLTGNLKYSDRFERQFEKYGPEKRAELQEHADCVAKFLESGDSRWNSRSVRFHQLQGKPEGGMTHEFYCFTGLEDRAFGIMQNGVFTISHIGDHL